MAVIINGRDLTIEQVISVCRHHEKVELAPEAVEAVKKARAYVEKKVAEKAVVYGLTTGFGKFANVAIDTEQTAVLQRNLIISHTCSMGKPYEQKYVRAAMLLRANSLARGNSGIRLETLQTLLDMLNAGIHPIVPEKGSVGASGDLAPLSCIALGLIGLGKVEYKGEVIEAKDAFAQADLTPVVLASKEGLALNNGTQMLTAVGLNTLYDAMNLMKIADIAGALTGEALHAIAKAYDPKTHLLRGHQGQMDAAENMRTLLEGSKNALPLHDTKVQDPYSQRCLPQIHGASRDAIAYVYGAVSREINAVTDNPIVFPDEDEVISGGNFHGQPMALAFDFLKIAISELANVAERRTERLVNPAMSEGAACVFGQGRRFEQRLYDRTVRRRVDGFREQGVRPPGLRGFDPDIGQSGGSRIHGRDLSQNRRDGTRQCAEGHRHRAGSCGTGDLAASGNGRTWHR